MLRPILHQIRMKDSQDNESQFRDTIPCNEEVSHSQLESMKTAYESSIELQQILFQIASIPFEPGNLDGFFEDVHRCLSKILYAENIIIATLDESEQKLWMDYFCDTEDTINRDEIHSIPSNRIKYTFTGYVLRTGEALLADHVKMQQLMASGEVAQLGKTCEYWLGAPLVLNEKTFGVLAVQSYDKNICYSQKDCDLLCFVATHISSVISRNKLTQEMHVMNEELKKTKRLLEEQVQSRTNELVKANHELHRLLREQEKSQAKLAHDALHDMLTGLPNRTLFIDKLLQAMFKNSGNSNNKFAVLFIDLDRFKVINDSLGHLTGDLLLKDVATRLLNTVRPCDSVARFGGDEFCILLENNIEHIDAVLIAEQIIESISKPFTLQGFEIFTSPSVGITLSQDYYQDPEEVLRDADSAMYQAKSQGKSCFAIFDVSMHEEALKRLKLESELRIAVNENQIEPFLQPIVDLESKEVIGFESLARWIHKDLGFISPVDFISIAEETGLIVDLGWQILEKAVNHIGEVRQSDPQYSNLTVSVNLSPKQLENHHIVENILGLLSAKKLPHSALKLEITESILIDNFDVAKVVINQFAEAGIKIMLDDFGTGYSSLSYMHHFPISYVKIDRSFINNMFTEETDMAVIKSVENLASGLKMQVVAEGVETVEQQKALGELGIHLGQGYLFSKPLALADIKSYLASTRN